MTIEIIIPITPLLEAIPNDVKLFIIFATMGLFMVILTKDFPSNPFFVGGFMFMGIAIIAIVHYIVISVLTTIPPVQIPDMSLISQISNAISIKVI